MYIIMGGGIDICCKNSVACNLHGDGDEWKFPSRQISCEQCVLMKLGLENLSDVFETA